MPRALHTASTNPMRKSFTEFIFFFFWWHHFGRKCWWCSYYDWLSGWICINPSISQKIDLNFNVLYFMSEIYSFKQSSKSIWIFCQICMAELTPSRPRLHTKFHRLRALFLSLPSINALYDNFQWLSYLLFIIIILSRKITTNFTFFSSFLPSFRPLA